jgi:hypothetical protein
MFCKKIEEKFTVSLCFAQSEQTARLHLLHLCFLFTGLKGNFIDLLGKLWGKKKAQDEFLETKLTTIFF